MRRIAGWQIILGLLIGAVLFATLVVVLLWLAVAAALLGAVLWLNLVVVPRVSLRLGVPRIVIEAVLLVALVGGGWWFFEINGAIVCGVIWVLGIGAPRLVGARLRARLDAQLATTHWEGTYRTVTEDDEQPRLPQP